MSGWSSAGLSSWNREIREINVLQPDFLNFEANQAFEPTFDSGQSTSITFDIPVDPGGYQFVIDNRGSTTPVNITATIVLAQEEVIDPNILGPQL